MEIKHKNKLVIGLTGGVGAGKSTVSGLLQKHYGALLIEADRICADLITPQGSSFAAVVNLLGDSVLDASGAIDRKKMAGMIFSDPSLRLSVNRILHPATFAAVRKRIAKSRKKLIVYESAIPYEARFGALCDKVLYVYASRRSREERLMASRGYSPEKIWSIMASQPDEAAYYSLADGVVNNDGSAADCLARLEALMSDWGLERLK